MTHIPDKEHITAGVFSVIAMIGGVARYSVSYLDGMPFSWGRFIASIAVSGFAGLMFGYFGSGLGLHDDILFVFSGVGGFMGQTTLHFIFNQLTKGEVTK